jgi:hypothetical protein
MKRHDILLERAEQPTGYRLETAKQAYDHVLRGVDLWIAMGNFLDDWYRAEDDQRRAMVREPIAAAPANSLELQRAAALFAAVIDWLSWINSPRLATPRWVSEARFTLREPWFIWPGPSMRVWQLVHSPAPFRMRNIFTDESIVSRA